MTKRSTLGGAALVGLALLFIGLTVLFDHALRGWRLDLTENRLYTTAAGTDRILASIKEPINLYFFYSEKTAQQLPQLKTYGTRVREFLEELAGRANGKLILHVIDPQPFSEEEDRAAELGVRGMPVAAAGGQFYFGLAGTNSTDGHAAVEVFDPHKEQFLEYDVIKLVYQLANPKKPVVAWLSTLPMDSNTDAESGRTREAWMVLSEARQLFEVRALAPGATRIDPDVNVLVLVHPKALSPVTQFAIDQFALRGGHILMFIDPLSENDVSGGDPQNPMAAMVADKSSHPDALLAAWGVAFDASKVVADRGRALAVTMREGEEPVTHPGVLGLDQSSFSDDVVTAGLSNINMAMAGALAPIEGSRMRFEPLLESSTDAQLLPSARFRLLQDPASLLDGFKPTGVRYTLAARVSGLAHTAFPDGPPAGVTLPAGQLDLKSSLPNRPMSLIVFADTDMLSDFLWVRMQNFFGQQVAQAWASNGDVVQNALGNLAGSADLISVRGRATFTRPFERVEKLRRAANERFRAKEQELESQLHDTEEKLTGLQAKDQKSQASVLVTPEQEREIGHFRLEKTRIRKELRAVRAGLDADIKGLGTRLKLINIVGVPLLFALLALGIATWRRRRASTLKAGLI